MFKLLFNRSSELKKLEAAIQKLHNDLINALDKHEKRTVSDNGDLFAELIIMAHFAKEEINARIARNEWNTMNRTVHLNEYGAIPIAVALQFTVFRLYKVAHDIGVHPVISRILSSK